MAGSEVGEDPVGEGRPVGLGEVGEVPVDREAFGPGPGAVDADGERVEELLDGQGAGHAGAEVRDRSGHDAPLRSSVAPIR